MLSLFKPPFWGRKLDKVNRFPSENLAFGIFRNYLLGKESRIEDNTEEIQNLIESELKCLQQAMVDTPPQDHYGLIEASLRRVDDRLKDL